MVLVWLAVLAGGLGLALVASRRAVQHGSVLAASTKIPPFIIGVTLFAVGTDLPEIANSLVASASDHGDLNVGDSVGSALVQATLVLGLLPFIVGPFRVRGRILVIGATTVAMLGLGAALSSDGHLSRGDAGLLIGGWLLGSMLVWRFVPSVSEPVMTVPTQRRTYHVLAALAALTLVGAGAIVAVAAFVRIAEELAISEYVISFFVASIGTSLPELVVVVTALKRGERDIAVGDVMGASLVDATLSIGIGPLFFPVAITAAQAVRGSLFTAAALVIVVVVLSRVRRHDRRTGLLLLGLYLASYAAVLTV